MTIYNIDMLQRRDTAADWTSNNPTLSAGEFGWEQDTNRLKIGDGSTAWTSLPYIIQENIMVAVSDETTALTTGTSKVTFRTPFAMTLTGVRANVVTAPTGSTIIVDINDWGTTILSTKLSIDAGEKSSQTAATPAVISDTDLADDAEITIDIDQVGSTIAGAGLKVTLIGYRT